MTLPERTQPLSNEERIEKIEAALESNAGMAVRGAFLIGLALAETGYSEDAIKEARLAAPDHGMGMAHGSRRS
jgi:hypothetical protein